MGIFYFTNEDFQNRFLRIFCEKFDNPTQSAEFR